jgi:hypothetical protein
MKQGKKTLQLNLEISFTYVAGRKSRQFCSHLYEYVSSITFKTFRATDYIIKINKYIFYALFSSVGKALLQLIQ